MDQRKLLLNERVEVRQFEEGLQGSWHQGKVVGISNLCRTVEYDELLSETGNAKLIECIPVTEAIEGLHRRRHVSTTYRGHIRPLPLTSNANMCEAKLRFGVCVDAFFKDAWWEGVIFDCNEDATERSVYFPDENDECKFSLRNLRVSRIWDEFSGIWTDRGVWVLLEVVRELEVDMPSSNYVKKLWLQLQANYGFTKMISEWTCGVRSMWKKYLRDAAYELGRGSSMKSLPREIVVVCNVRKDRRKARSTCDLIDTSVELKYQQESNVVTLAPNGEESLPSKPQKQNFTMKLRSKSGNPGSADDAVGDCNAASSESLYSGGHTANLNRTNVIMEVDCARISRINSRLNRKRVNAFGGRIHKKLLGKVRIKENHMSKPDADDAGHGLSFSESRQQTVAFHTRSHVENKHLPSRNLKKLKPGKQKVGIFFPECGQKQLRREAFLLFGNKKKRSVRRNKNSEEAQHADVCLKPSSNREGTDAFEADSELFATRRRKAKVFQSFGKEFRLKDMVSSPRKCKRKRAHLACPQSDTICFVCHYTGDLVHCRHCFSSYHLGCLQLKVVPNDKWICPSCCCGLCGGRDSINGNQQMTNACFQCTRQYHVNCLDKVGSLYPSSYPSDRFCSNACYQLYVQLHLLLGTSNSTTVDGLTWTMIRSMRNECKACNITRNYSSLKISHALKVIKESFQPITELHTNRDLIKDIVFNSVSKLKRLDFRGFYLMVLHKGDEIASVATVRILGPRLAEMPLVATSFQFRRQGMCRVLMCELEKLLVQLGVERLILPAASQVRTTWEASFGFTEMPISDRQELLGYPLLGFQGTTMIQKFLRRSICKTTRASDEARSRALLSLVAGSMDQSRLCRLCYKRKLRDGGFGKENRMGSCNGGVHRYQLVYKRRRILAGRD
ncbi:uncharacterized protein LOC115750485 isoform X1 [Rhodamnia argentea]|uniref:Uncharacterized protein LOC115750485 isoform X1 n=1 Tax=Rhodamnia argentea TaxID=178133 RepID=A0ABM3GVI7_9MYRT|nr:uncharacterized protein LOC115750485 isoform X1 [Rhodamnia argentea]